jgi:hypothetical protein
MGKHDEMGMLVDAAKKDPRYKAMSGDDEYTETETDDTDTGDGLDACFSKSQAAAIRAAIKAGC